MLNLKIELGTEISTIDEPIVKIKVPHTKFFVIGEKTGKGKWNMSVQDPETNIKTIVRKGITTSTFAIFSNVILKTPFPYNGKDVTSEIIKKHIKKTIKNK